MDVDLEGRAVLTQHRVEGLEGSALVVVNVYCPHVDVEREDRQQFKLSFYHALQKRVVALQRAGKWVDRSGNTYNYSYDMQMVRVRSFMVPTHALSPMHTCSAVVVAGDFNCSYNAIDSAYALDDPVSSQHLAVVCHLSTEELPFVPVSVQGDHSGPDVDQTVSGGPVSPSSSSAGPRATGGLL